MKSSNLKYILFSIVAAGSFSGCVNDDVYDKTAAICITATPTKSVSDIYAVATAVPTKYTADDIIEAYVTSNDAGGTFYKSISFQTLDATRAFSIPVDMYNIYTEFEPGRKVYVNLKDRTIGIANGSLVIGDLFEGNAVGRLVPEEFRRTVKASCESVDEEALVQHFTIAQAKNDAHINKLIEFDNVQFDDEGLGSTYYNPDNVLGGATNLQLSDGSGARIIFRTSEFAKFAGKTVQGGRGKVRGVLTKFNSDYQFLARTESDIMLTGERIDATPPLGGSDIQYLSTFTETFESFPVANTVFPKYINDAVIGSRYWGVKSFSSNEYIEMTSFGSGARNRTIFAMPAAFTPGSKFSFKSKDGFNNGDVLNVYYSTDYVLGADINTATLVNITSNFTIASGTTSGYAVSFTNSGDFVIPATLSGNGFFIFEYNGNGASGGILTTTIQIDDVTLVP